MAALVFGSAEALATLRREKGLSVAAKEWIRYTRATARAKKKSG